MANLDSEFFGLVFPGLQATQKIHAHNSRPELSACLSNFTFSNPKFIHGDFLLMGETKFLSALPFSRIFGVAWEETTVISCGVSKDSQDFSAQPLVLEHRDDPRHHTVFCVTTEDKIKNINLSQILRGLNWGLFFVLKSVRSRVLGQDFFNRFQSP